jgi:hypothetical protein
MRRRRYHPSLQHQKLLATALSSLTNLAVLVGNLLDFRHRPKSDEGERLIRVCYRGHSGRRKFKAQSPLVTQSGQWRRGNTAENVL